MSDIDLASLLKATEDPKQAESLMGMLDEAVKFVQGVDKIVSTLQKWGVSPEIVERLAIKFGKLEEVKPLPKSQSVAGTIVPASELHAQMFDALNSMSVEQLKQAAETMQKQGEHEGRNAKARKSDD